VEGAPRGGIDADLLQQTVQAVVAAVTAATRPKDVPVAQPPVVAQVSVPASDIAQAVEAPVAVPSSSASLAIPECNEMAAIDKENEGQGAPKKKKEDKAGCFRCKNLGIILMTVLLPSATFVSPFTMSHLLATCLMLQNLLQFFMGMQMRGLCFLSLHAACSKLKPKIPNWRR
jgi:hypothetical protein